MFTSRPPARAVRQLLSNRFGPKLHFINLSTLRAGGMRAAASALLRLKADLVDASKTGYSFLFEDADPLFLFDENKTWACIF